MNDTKSKEKYYAYLQTDAWKEIRDWVVKRDLGRCRVCNSSKLLNVHHRKYPEVYGEEPLIDLVTLCRKCHDLFHGNLKIIREKPISTIKPISPQMLLRNKAKSILIKDGFDAKNNNVKHLAKLILKNYFVRFPNRKKKFKNSECMGIIEFFINKNPPKEV